MQLLKQVWYHDEYFVFQKQITRSVTPQARTSHDFHIVTKEEIKLIARAWPRHLSYLGCEENKIAQLLDRRLSAGDKGIIAIIDGTLAYMSWLSWKDFHLAALCGKENEELVCWKNIFVDPRFRRQNLAKDSFSKVLEILRPTKSKLCYAFVQSSNLPSKALFESMAFEMSGLLTFGRHLLWNKCGLVALDGRAVSLVYPEKGTFIH